MAKYQKVNAATTKRVNSLSLAIEAIQQLDNGDVAMIILQKYDRDQAHMEQPDKPHNIKTSVVQRETWHGDVKTWKIPQDRRNPNRPRDLRWKVLIE